ICRSSLHSSSASMPSKWSGGERGAKNPRASPRDEPSKDIQPKSLQDKILRRIPPPSRGSSYGNFGRFHPSGTAFAIYPSRTASEKQQHDSVTLRSSMIHF